MVLTELHVGYSEWFLQLIIHRFVGTSTQTAKRFAHGLQMICIILLLRVSLLRLYSSSLVCLSSLSLVFVSLLRASSSWLFSVLLLLCKDLRGSFLALTARLAGESEYWGRGQSHGLDEAKVWKSSKISPLSSVVLLLPHCLQHAARTPVTTNSFSPS